MAGRFFQKEARCEPSLECLIHLYDRNVNNEHRMWLHQIHNLLNQSNNQIPTVSTISKEISCLNEKLCNPWKSDKRILHCQSKTLEV